MSSTLPQPPASASATTTSRPRPSTSIKQPQPYRPIQLNDIIHKLSASISTRSSSYISHTQSHSHHQHQTLSSHHHPLSLPPCSPPILHPHLHSNHPSRTITPAEASLAASTSLERSDNHRAMLHQKAQKTRGTGSLNLRTRYSQQEDGRQPSALQRMRRPSPTVAGSEFLVLWDAWDNLKRVIVKALQRRRVRKGGEAMRTSRNTAATTTETPARSQANWHQGQSKPLPPKPLPPKPLPPYPTPIYDAHRKHRSRPAPKEFYLAWAAVKDQQKDRTPSPPRLPTITRKPLPPTATAAPVSAPQPEVVVPAAVVVPPTSPPRLLRRTSQKITQSSNIGERQQRQTRFSDFLPSRPKRVQSNILTGSGKQIRLCDVCGCSCCAASGAKFGRGGVWLCAGCSHGEGGEGEMMSGNDKVDIPMPMGKDVVWNCEHCFANFASERPVRGEVCVCPVCGGEIGGVGRYRSGLLRKGKGQERSHFSQTTEATERVFEDRDNDDDEIARPSIYRPSLYEDDPIISTDDSPVSPVGQGRFDNVDGSAVHPAFRPLPPTPGIPPTSPLEKRPDTAWRNSIRTCIPGIDASRSYHTGPVTHVEYEYPSNSSTASAFTPQAPVPTPTVTYFKSKTEQWQKEAQCERKSRAVKHMPSSIYPEDQKERVYMDDKPLPEMPRNDRKRSSSYYPNDS